MEYASDDAASAAGDYDQPESDQTCQAEAQEGQGETAGSGTDIHADVTESSSTTLALKAEMAGTEEGDMRLEAYEEDEDVQGGLTATDPAVADETTQSLDNPRQGSPKKPAQILHEYLSDFEEEDRMQGASKTAAEDAGETSHDPEEPGQETEPMPHDDSTGSTESPPATVSEASDGMEHTSYYRKEVTPTGADEEAEIIEDLTAGPKVTTYETVTTPSDIIEESITGESAEDETQGAGAESPADEVPHEHIAEIKEGETEEAAPTPCEKSATEDGSGEKYPSMRGGANRSARPKFRKPAQGIQEHYKRFERARGTDQSRDGNENAATAHDKPMNKERKGAVNLAVQSRQAKEGLRLTGAANTGDKQDPKAHGKGTQPTRGRERAGERVEKADTKGAAKPGTRMPPQVRPPPYMARARSLTGWEKKAQPPAPRTFENKGRKPRQRRSEPVRSTSSPQLMGPSSCPKRRTSPPHPLPPHAQASKSPTLEKALKAFDEGTHPRLPSAVGQSISLDSEEEQAVPTAEQASRSVEQAAKAETSKGKTEAKEAGKPLPKARPSPGFRRQVVAEGFTGRKDKQPASSKPVKTALSTGAIPKAAASAPHPSKGGLKDTGKTDAKDKPAGFRRAGTAPVTSLAKGGAKEPTKPSPGMKSRLPAAAWRSGTSITPGATQGKDDHPGMAKTTKTPPTRPIHQGLSSTSTGGKDSQSGAKAPKTTPPTGLPRRTGPPPTTVARAEAKDGVKPAPKQKSTTGIWRSGMAQPASTALRGKEGTKPSPKTTAGSGHTASASASAQTGAKGDTKDDTPKQLPRPKPSPGSRPLGTRLSGTRLTGATPATSKDDHSLTQKPGAKPRIPALTNRRSSAPAAATAKIDSWRVSRPSPQSKGPAVPAKDKSPTSDISAMQAVGTKPPGDGLAKETEPMQEICAPAPEEIHPVLETVPEQEMLALNEEAKADDM